MINISDIELSNSCWNKYKDLHTDKVVYFKKIYSIFKNFKALFVEFQNNYNGLEFYDFICQITGNQFNELMKDFDKTIKNFFSVNSVFIDYILKEFSNINNNIISENANYEKVNVEYKKYKEKKDKFDRIKNNFNNKMGTIEESLKEKIIKGDKITIDMKKLSSAMKDFNEYKNNLEDLDKLRESFNNGQKKLLEENYKELIKNEAICFENIKIKFCSGQKSLSENSIRLLENYKYLNSKEAEKQKLENENNYINKIIEKYKNNSKPEEKLKLFEYYLRYKPYEKNSDDKIEDITKANQINEEILKYLKKAIRDNYPDSGLKIQEATYKVHRYYELFFTHEYPINKELKEQMLKVLKEDNNAYHSILIELAKMRAETKFFESKDNMEFVTVLLIEILKLIEKKHDLKAVKDCILLSQTYYILDENNNKIYSFEKLRKYKWIRTVKFWREFLDYYLNRAFDKFEFDYGLDVKVKDNPPKLKQKTKEKVKDVLFSCLVPYINNMNEIKIDKRIILKLLDEIIEKYQYLDEVSIQNLEVFISNSSEEIKQLRKEYKDNPDLENEIDNEIMNEKDEIVENEENEEKEEIDKIIEKEEKEEKKEKEEKEKKEDIKEKKEEKEDKKEKIEEEEKKEDKKEIKEEVDKIIEKEEIIETKEKEIKENVEVKEEIKEKEIKD